MSDAIVALRSFPRRFGEELAGPLDDDAWVRLLTARADGGLSALDTVQQATLRLDALATTLTQLPHVATLKATTTFDWEHLNDLGPMPGTTFASLMAKLKKSANAAADAVESRRDEDLDREITLDKAPSTIGEHLGHVVNQTATEIRHLNELLSP